MTKYQVEIQRTITQLAIIEVDAVNKRDACTMANARRETVEWSTTDTDYEVSDLYEVA
jgi:hypothetical protein